MGRPRKHKEIVKNETPVAYSTILKAPEQAARRELNTHKGKREER